MSGSRESRASLDHHLAGGIVREPLADRAGIAAEHDGLAQDALRSRDPGLVRLGRLRLHLLMLVPRVWDLFTPCDALARTSRCVGGEATPP